MALELNPVAFTSAPLLRAIAAGGWTSKADLARRAGRHPNNLPRDLTVLWEAGLINEVSTPALTEHAEDQLAALDRAENPGAEEGLGVTHALHADLVPDPDQPRKDFASAQAVADLDELRQSIALRGRILQPLAVRPLPDEPGRFIITDGERRWRAVGNAIWEGDWPETRPLPITIQQTDAKETRLSQLTANMVRADMTPLEEADAFADLVETHGMRTAEIADELGVSQKLVQNRLRLRQLSDDDRARMALPEDDPEHLGYKAALQSLMTPRDTPASAEQGGGAATGESGSPQPAAKPFGATLTDAEALALVEIAHKSERDPDPDYGSEAYTPVSAAGIHGAAQSLVTRGLIGFRQKGMTVLVKPRLFTTPYGDWLKELGFFAGGDDRRRAILSEFRNRVHGPDVAARLDADEGYATPWLNPAAPVSAPPVGEGGCEAVEGAPDASDPDFDAREAGLVSRMESHLAELEDDQPALIEETVEERAARAAAGREREAVERDQAVVARFSEEMLRAMADARAGLKLFGDLFRGQTGSNDVLDDLVGAALGGLAVADPALAGAALAHLVTRGGSMGAAYRLKTLTLPAAHDLMLSARVEQSRPLDDDDAYAEPDPVEDFIRAELPEGEDEHETSEAPTGDAAERPVPAVPVRKSITPDFIVCLEDGRKFRSLKRHLRTRYDLTPEEYIARWGLPRDYPMVAPNYAKARADLARQMGLREPV